MPTIFDLFGYPLDDRSEEAEKTRRARRCPFMDAECDGGGNRYQTKIKLTSAEPLASYFNEGIKEVVPGVCSLMAGADVWVVCPRRLFAALHTSNGMPPVNRALQSYERNLLLKAGVPQGINVGIWAEVVIKQKIDDADINYHFDYIVAPLIELTITQALNSLGVEAADIAAESNSCVKSAKITGYFSKGQTDLANVPILMPDMTNLFILEVMTASTSGSDTENETDMRNAFRNALLFNEHTSPGINKRQVWGRMVTQLFAKTALADEWGGRAVWILQDELLRNIELTTRLNTKSVAEASSHNINVIVMHYDVQTDGSRRMSFKSSIEGDAGINFDGNDTFTDILLPKFAPNKTELLKAILRRKVGAIIRL